MATTADYLNKLITQKNTLADNLVTKGVTATHAETLETLVPKVLDISGGGKSDIGIEFDMTYNLLSDIVFNSELTVNKSGQTVTITIPSNYASSVWKPLISATQLDLNRMYYICSDNYNGFGRIGISKSSSSPWTNCGTNAYGKFPFENISENRDGDNHVIKYGYNEAWFYLNYGSGQAFEKKTGSFSLWFVGDEQLNDKRDGFTFTLGLYAEKR